MFTESPNRIVWGLLLTALCLPGCAFASIIAWDDFNSYASGTALAGQGGANTGGWSSNWVAGAATTVAANSTNAVLTFTPVGGSPLGDGNSLSIGGTGSGTVVSRALSNALTGTFYAAMLVKWDGGALNTGNSLAIYLSDSETNVSQGFNFGLYGIWNTYGNSVRVGTNAPVAGAYKALPAQFSTYYMVVKVEKSGGDNYDKITGWVNPASNSETTKPTGDIQLLANSGVSNVTSVIFRADGFNTTAPNGPDYTLVDDVMLATTFADLMAPVPVPVVRPLIWVRETERPGILAKIADNTWATNLFNALVNRVAADVASHQADRNTWLRQLPVDWTLSPAKFKTIPAYAESVVRGPAELKYNRALDCAVLYYLTGDAKYAQCAADVLHNAVKTLLPVVASPNLVNGGWIFQDDLLKEARVVGTQLPVVYDFLYEFLQSNQVYDVQTAGLVNFSFTNAQNVFSHLLPALPGSWLQ